MKKTLSGNWNGAWGEGAKPFWRRFVDPSDDPEVIAWCQQRIQRFLDSGARQEEMEWLSNPSRNTIRSMAPEMGDIATWFIALLVSGGHSYLVYSVACHYHILSQ